MWVYVRVNGTYRSLLLLSLSAAYILVHVVKRDELRWKATPNRDADDSLFYNGESQIVSAYGSKRIYETEREREERKRMQNVLCAEWVSAVPKIADVHVHITYSVDVYIYTKGLQFNEFSSDFTKYPTYIHVY